MRRLRYLVSRLPGNRLQNSQSTSFPRLNGRRFKRLILRDTALAAELEHNLEAFHGSPHFPPLVIRYEREVWLDYVAGGPIVRLDPPVVEKIADFYAAAYSHSPRTVDIGDTPFVARLQRDLRFLNRVGIVSDAAWRDLRAAARRLAPGRVWVGFDYVDAVLKNFIVTDKAGLVCGIDAESLRKDQLIGTGVANALARWLEPFQDRFFGHLMRAGVPDFRPYLPFVELCYRSAWTKLYFFEKKWKRIDPGAFERFRAS